MVIESTLPVTAWAVTVRGHGEDYIRSILLRSRPYREGLDRGPKDVTPDLNKWAANLSKIPVYAFAGVKDRVVPAERSQRMIDAIQKREENRRALSYTPMKVTEPVAKPFPMLTFINGCLTSNASDIKKAGVVFPPRKSP